MDRTSRNTPCRRAVEQALSSYNPTHIRRFYTISLAILGFNKIRNQGNGGCCIISSSSLFKLFTTTTFSQPPSLLLPLASSPATRTQLWLMRRPAPWQGLRGVHCARVEDFSVSISRTPLATDRRGFEVRQEPQVFVVACLS